jgi:hypothetical protein
MSRAHLCRVLQLVFYFCLPEFFCREIIIINQTKLPDELKANIKHLQTIFEIGARCSRKKDETSSPQIQPLFLSSARVQYFGKKTEEKMALF